MHILRVHTIRGLLELVEKKKNQFNSVFKVELDLRNYLLLKSISVEQMHKHIYSNSCKVVLSSW